MRMKKTLAINAALAAIAISLGGAAHAQTEDAEQATATLSADEAGPSDGALTPRYGDINPFYGNIDPFYGNIDPFYGDIDAFWGDINPFYGNINPFYGDIDAFWGDINPFYGDIDAFWGDIDAFYGDIDAFNSANLNAIGAYGNASGTQIKKIEGLFNSISRNANGSIVRDGTPNKVMAALGVLISQGRNQFGATYTAKTGKSFDDLVNEIFARHGVSPNSKASIEVMTAKQRAALYMDWNDTMMGLSGIDHVDHWMRAINWTPGITRIQGEGERTIIGIVDGSFSADGDLGNNIVWSGGYSNNLQGHGAGVASLIAGAHDGDGVMGIAPGVMITTYNPFGSDGTASYEDVANGIVSLIDFADDELNGYGKTSIINLSLGESGWVLSQGMADVLNWNGVKQEQNRTVFVVAAGNEGISQTVDVEFKDPDKLALILVGSVSPNGEISSFSNRPGSAFLLDKGKEKPGNELYKRFVVAPGELILVSDGKGGVVRRSGTSFAAPLVSGAVSLLHDRWPWLVKKPHESAEIIFRSAKDLGAPGPDEVYGWGLLDVAASQSPLDFNSMKFNYYFRDGSDWKHDGIDAKELISLVAGIPDWWEFEDVFFTMFEKVGSTERDFAVPMSSFTRGRKTNALGNGDQYLQDFITDRFTRWILSGGSDSNGDGVAGFSEIRSSGEGLNGSWSLRYDAVLPRVTDQGSVKPVHSAATLTNPNGKLSLTLGHGQGSMALSGGRFGMISDHMPGASGVNPVLGMASGEVFAAASYKLAPNTTMRVGYSDNREKWHEIDGLDPLEAMIRRELGTREAHAMTVDLEQQVTKAVTVNAQWTHLREDNALLGAQTSIDAFLGNGSTTDAITVSGTLDVGGGLSLDMSATGATTQLAQGQAFSNGSKVWSSAGQFAATKRGVVGKRDMLRLSVGQPLNIETGEIEFRSRQVIDRTTGETGMVVQTFGIEGKRGVIGEGIYAAPIGDNGELGLFGRYESNVSSSETENYTVGGSLRLRF